MMKKISLLSLMLCIALTSFAQEDRTIFGGRDINISVGGFGGPTFKYSQLMGENAFATGGGGGLIINDFFIGGHGTGVMASNLTINDELRDVEMGYGGLWLGYSLWDSKPVHPFLSAKIGGGTVELYDPTQSIDRPIASDNLLVLEPEVGIELNLFQWFKVAGTIGYRSVNGADDGFITNAEASGITAGVSLRFGFFGSARNRDDD